MIKKVSLALMVSIVGFGSVADAVRVNVPCPTVEDLQNNTQSWVRHQHAAVDPHRPGGVPAAPTFDAWSISVPGAIHHGGHTIKVRWLGTAYTDTTGHPPVISGLTGIEVRPDGMLSCAFTVQNADSPARSTSHFTMQAISGRFDHCVVAGQNSFTCTYSN